MTKNIAHRGYSACYPENTLLAFERALETGCDGIELDIHLTADRRLVVIHDEEVDRTTDGHGCVKDMTLAQLRELHLGRGQRIPTLAEYFDLVRDTPVFTNIELKNSVFRYEGMEEQAVGMIREYGLSGRVLFSSFNHYSLLECKRLAPEIPCGPLTWSWLVDAGAYTRKLGMECYHPEFHALTAPAVAELHGRGVTVNAYTADRRQDMERLLSLGIGGIITDDPALLGEALRQRQAAAL